MHDPRIGRFFAVDPLAPEYPHNSPYAFSENRVIDAIEYEGLESIIYTVRRDYKDGNVTVKVSEKKLKVNGKLGGGAAVIFDKDGKETHYMYGNKLSSLKDFKIHMEGYRNDVYPSLEGGTPTVGVGHKMSAEETKRWPVGTILSDAEVNELFEMDFAEHSDRLNNNSATKGLSGGQRNAMVDFVFNVGSTKGYSSGDGADFFLGYLAGGKGIIKRRVGEFIMFKDNAIYGFEFYNDQKTKDYLKGLNTQSNSNASPSTNQGATSAPDPLGRNPAFKGALWNGAGDKKDKE